VEKERDAGDSRVTRVRLTEQGKALEEDFREISRGLLEAAYTGFSGKDKEVLIALLARMHKNL
jgi:DNA-binding MarR family transcriptional regulator